MPFRGRIGVTQPLSRPHCYPTDSMSALNARRYDFRQEMDLLAPIVERARAALSEEQKISIQSACRNLRFANRVQFSPMGDSQHVMTMQDLSDVGLNDPGIQGIDAKAIDRLLLGDYGMIEHKRLNIGRDSIGKIGERPLIVYFQQDPDDEPSKPCNAAGRHRNYAWQILMLLCDVEWDLAMQQPMWVDKTIARNKDESTMLMTLANGSQSRKQPPAELKSYDLTRRNVRIDDLERLVSTRLAATQNQFGDVIATGATMTVANDYTDQAVYIYDRVKTSWTKASRLSPEHKKKMVDAFKTDSASIADLIQRLGDWVGTFIDEESERNSAKTIRERVNERTTDLICKFFSLTPGEWSNDKEAASKALANLSTKQRQLEAFV